ncbi:hypothetical protein AB0I90_16645 [Micromonospora wenchangensis]|uniref:hypothetical protein n=1 Tax=Micromonospora wenchangensis TaxID=1185415 RepID=UPI0033E24DE1
MSPGGTDASLLELAVGLVVAVSLVAAITVVLRRRGDRRDLPGTQVRELEARVAAAASPDGAAGDRPVQDPTSPPSGWPSTPGGNGDAMADAFAWLRIAALVEAGQREQAVELLGATMAISVDEAELLVDGLDGAGDRHTGGARWRD